MKSPRDTANEFAAALGVTNAPPQVSDKVEAAARQLVSTTIAGLMDIAPGLGASNAMLLIANTATAFLASLDESLTCEALILMGRARRAAMQGRGALAERCCRELYEVQLKLHFMEEARAQKGQTA